MMTNRLIQYLTQICVLFLFISLSGAQSEWEEPINHVSDFANVISQNNENRINALAKKLEEVTQDELAVVTIQSYEDRGFASIEETAVDLFESWGIGQQDQDNGLLVLVAIDERRWRIEVGYGLEGVIPDAVASSLGRNILPDFFRADNYGQGLEDLSIALVARIAEQKNIPLSEFQIQESQAQQQRRASSQDRGGGFFQSIMGILGMIFFIYMFVKHPRLMLLLMLMNSGGRRSHWGGGSQFVGGFGGGSFGGGGGFGGGMSGGGGASGGW